MFQAIVAKGRDATGVYMVIALVRAARGSGMEEEIVGTAFNLIRLRSDVEYAAAARYLQR